MLLLFSIVLYLPFDLCLYKVSTFLSKVRNHLRTFLCAFALFYSVRRVHCSVWNTYA